MTPENHIPRPERIGASIRLTAAPPARTHRGPGRFGPGTQIKTLVTTALVALLVAGWGLVVQHAATHAAPARPQAPVAALGTRSAPATSTSPVPATPQAPAQAPTTAVPARTPARVTVPAVPVAAMQTPMAAEGLGRQPTESTVPSFDRPLLVAPTATPTTTPASAPTRATVLTPPSLAIIAGFPSVTQWYNLDCEYAAAAAVTLYWGHLVSQNTFVNVVPSNPNPHLGFRGAINAPFGGLTDYGVYAEALVPVLEQRGYNAAPFYGGATRLKAEIAAGHPVVVWITAGKYVSRTPVAARANGATFTLVPGEHAVVIYGYDRGGVYIMDVSHGRFDYAMWGSFLPRWSYFDQMALVITPQ